MANPKLPDPEHVQYAHDEMAKGRSSREVAAELATLGVPVSHMTVARWAKQWKARAFRAEPLPPGGNFSNVLPTTTVGRETGKTPAAQTLPKPNPLAAEIEARKAATPPAPPVDTSDTLGTLRGLLESFMGEAHRSREGNPRLATTLAKSAADVLDQIRKIEARQAEDENCLRLSRDEIAKAHAAALERFKALCDRPLLCSDCGRKLAIAWGEAGEKVAEAEKSEGV